MLYMDRKGTNILATPQNQPRPQNLLLSMSRMTPLAHCQRIDQITKPIKLKLSINARPLVDNVFYKYLYVDPKMTKVFPSLCM